MTFDDDKILRDIYSQIYIKDPNFTINIFLCGASTNEKDTLRDTLFQKMKSNPKFNVVFPEWLFASLNWTKYNLLDLETELGSYVDAILIPLEGFGTFAELGAFTQNKKLLPKIIVLNDFAHKHKKSFINLGPIDLIKRSHPNNIKYFNKNKNKIIDLNDLISYTINKLLRFPKSSDSKLDISNLFNLSRFLLFVIAIYQPINEEEVFFLLKKYRTKQTIQEHIIKPSLQVLINKEFIRQKLINQKNYFVLTEVGNNFVFEELLPNLGVVKAFSRIRGNIISKRGRSKYKFKHKVGVKKYLDGIVQ